MAAAPRSDPASAGDPRALTGSEKVAVLLLALGKSKAEALLRRFEPEELRLLTRSTTDLRPISAGDLDTIVEEFADKFATGITFTGSGQEVEALLSSVMSEELPQLDLPPAEEVEPAWNRIVEAGHEILNPYLTREHPQTIALILSKMEPGAAADIIKTFQGDLRVGVLRRMLAIKRPNDEAVAALEQALREDLLSVAAPTTGPDTKSAIAGILNKLDRAQADELLASLAAERPEDAKALKNMLFSFEDLVNLTAKARGAIFDKVPIDGVVLALNGTAPEFQTFILASLGGRARRMVEAELQGGSARPAREVASARQSIVDIVLRMVANGEIRLGGDEAA